MKDYFDVHRGDWDGIYSAPAGSLRWHVNRRFRRAVWRRMLLAIDQCSEIAGRSVLDVGCGTGELGLRLASQGAARVLGIDRSEEMVRAANGHAETRGIMASDFVRADFFAHDFGGEHFDYVVALGVLDYVGDATGFLDRMWRLTRRRLIASLPHSVPPRSWVRRAWHGLHGSTLFYYTREEVDRFGVRLAPGHSTVHTLPGTDRSYVLVCDRESQVGA